MTGAKAEYRQRYLAVRRGMDDATRRAHCAAIVARVLAWPPLAGTQALLTYRPMGAEVDPGGVAAWATKAGIVVYAAASERGPLVWTRTGRYEHAPADDAGVRTAIPHGPLVVLVPGVAFDEAGGRLGRGGGFYDRSLAALRATGSVYAVGLAYEAQMAARVPRDAWDEPVDVVATERRLVVSHACETVVA
jgi:5-formyltetrahydrofolate cyclo-ligase